MKDGSFEIQIPDLDFEQIAGEVQKIKTPDQVPDRIDLSQVPHSVLRSGVIDSLIQQNEDLMSRLTVTLRRVATLEEKLVDTEAESLQVKNKYENAKDQILILREQSRKITERLRANETHRAQENLFQKEAKDQIQVLEIRYAELYTSSQDRQTRLEEKVLLLERVIRCYRKYRAHVKRIYSALHAELKNLREKQQTQAHMISDLKQNLSESTDYITRQSKEHKDNLTALTSAYEVEIKNHKGEIEMLIEQNRILGERSHDYDRVYNEKIKLENDIVIAERREEDLRMQSSVELSNLQKSLARHRNDAKALAIELEAKTSEATAQTFIINDLTTQKSALNEQVDTLQLLWRDQQNQLEKTTEQKNSLQKLNQEMSILINEHRREIRELKEKLDAEAQKVFEFKNIEEKKRELNSKSIAIHAIKREDVVTPEIISNIDKALNDLHVGR